MGLKDQAVTWRRYFHQFPELSDKEFKTTQKIKDILTEHHIRILDLPLMTGLVAEVGQGLSCIAVRADIDALPIQELVEQDLNLKMKVLCMRAVMIFTWLVFWLRL